MTTRLTSAAVLAGTLALVAGTLPASAYFVPGGSYAASCRSIRMNGPVLSAYCRRVDGSGMWSSVVVPRCAGTGISNQNGRLVCGGYFR